MLIDFGYALRTWRRNPTLWVTAALSLSLGIGTTTAVFSVANTVLWRGLPYADPGRW